MLRDIEKAIGIKMPSLSQDEIYSLLTQTISVTPLLPLSF